MFNESDGDSDPTSPNNYTRDHLFTMLVLAVTFLVGVPGNILVLWVTGVKMKRTVTTVWFWNLALADITCCLSLPCSFVQFFYQEWLYGPVICKILPSIVILNMSASIFTLVAISIDRCILVVRPVWAQNHRSLRMAWLVCLVIWMLSFLMCLPVFIYRETFLFNNITKCIYKYYLYSHDEYLAISYAITYTRMTFAFLFPLVIISACYIRLTLTVHNTRFVKEGRKTTKVVFSIIVAFFVTWAPYHIIGIILLYDGSRAVIILDGVSQALAYSNSCINPILYVFMGKDFKSKLRQSLYRQVESVFREETITRSTEHSRNETTILDSAANITGSYL
ncbi:C3a anaphylatoxin chemotactic receptor-like [Pseudophryne corroboree]|uniref:C3a anaphylatoxin chemotactic receptor-like n=1 Tax=Pseudophryne corroboree TaxID=495146 RepID=UPI0030818C29